MKTCARCKYSMETKLTSEVIICKDCFAAWTENGSNLDEYMGRPYKPEPVKYPAGYGVADDFPM